MFVVKTLYTDYTDEDISRCVCEGGGIVSLTVAPPPLHSVHHINSICNDSRQLE